MDTGAASIASGLAESPGPGPDRKSSRFERIAAELSGPEQILEAIHARAGRRRAAPEPGRPIVAPRTEIESELAAIWAGLLRLEPVGIHDNYFDLGGTSLLAVDLFARIEQPTRQETASDLADRSPDHRATRPPRGRRDRRGTPWC